MSPGHANQAHAAPTDSPGEDSVVLEEILQSLPDHLAAVAKAPEHGVQIHYARIHRSPTTNGGVRFEEHGWRLNSQDYFYPASTVKFPVALLALEKLATLSTQGVDRRTPMLTDRSRPWQTERHTDPSAPSGLPSVGNDVQRIFLVSDNDAFNRLFEFVGIESIHSRLRGLGRPGPPSHARGSPTCREACA